MLVMVVLGAILVVLVVVRAQLEDVRQRREQEQQHLQHQLLGRADADDERQHPEQFHLDQLDDQHDGEQAEQQLVAEEFLCKCADQLMNARLARRSCKHVLAVEAY